MRHHQDANQLKEAESTIRKLKLEGLVAKKRSSKYSPGLRGHFWFKQRFDRGQEFVIGGFKGRRPLESLLVGYYDGRKLRYAAKVKAGLTPALRQMLAERLEPLRTDACPFANLPERIDGRWGEGLTAMNMQECFWVKPKLIAQVNFVEWTEHGHLRHAGYLGLRDDKRPRDVIRESAD